MDVVHQPRLVLFVLETDSWAFKHMISRLELHVAAHKYEHGADAKSRASCMYLITRLQVTSNIVVTG